MADTVIIHNQRSNIYTWQSSILKPTSIRNLGTWQQILLATTDILLILEHSFHLFHQKDSQPLLSAAQQYKTSNIPIRIKSAMKGIFDQYGKASKEEKIEMILNVILQNQISI